jgi:hypothetical protein
MRRLVPPALLAGALLAFAASPAFAVSTRAEYALEVNVICQEAESDFDEAFEGFFKRRGLGSFIAVLDRSNDVSERMVANIATVPPAPGDEALASEWVRNFQKVNLLNDRWVDLFKKLLRKFKPLYARAAQAETPEEFEQIKPKSPAGRSQLRRMGIRQKRLLLKSFRAAEKVEKNGRELGAIGCVGESGLFRLLEAQPQDIGS